MDIKPLRNLARIRVNRSLSQAELASAAGFVQQYVSQLERGLHPSDPSHVLRIAAVLQVDPAALTAQELTICTSPSGAVTVKHE